MATRYLANGASGSWFSTSNWTSTDGGAPGASVPTSADDVIINFSGVNGALTIDGAAACLSLTFADTTDITTTFTFTAGGSLAVTGNLTMSGGSVGGTPVFIIAGTVTTSTFVVGGNLIHRTGTITLSANCGISAATYSAPNNALTAARVFNFGSSSTLRLTSTATSTHLDMTSTAPALTVNNSGGTIQFSGAIASGITRTITYTPTTSPANYAPTMSVTGGASGSTTVFTATTLSSLSFTGYSGTWSIANALTFRRPAAADAYSLVLSTGMTVSGTAVVTFGVGTGSVTSSGKTLTSSIVVNNTGGVLSLADAFITSNTFTHTAGELKLNTRTLTCLTFASSNSNTRTLAFGTGKIVTTTTATATAWTTSTVTGLTVTGTPLVEITGAGTTVRTVATGALSEANSISFSLLLSAAGTVTFSGAVVRNLTVNMATGILTNVALTIYGNVTTTTGTLSAGTNAWTFASTILGHNLSSAGITWDFPVTFAGTGANTYILATNITVGAARATTLTSGTLNLGTWVLTTGTFSSSNSNVRTINFGASGRIDFSSTTATTTLLTLTTITNLTISGTPTIGTVGAGTQSRVITNGAAVSEATAWNFRVNTTGGSTTIPTYTRTLTQVAGTVSNGTLSLYGGFIWTAGSISSSAVNFVATSGTWPLSFTNLPESLVFNGTGGTWQLSADCSIASTNSTTLTAGTLNLNGFTLQTGVFASTNSNVRTIAFGTGKIVTTTTSAATAWDTGTITGLTVTGTPLVEITGGGTTVRTINSGALSESTSISFTLLLSASGTITFTAGNTVKDLTINMDSPAVLSNTALTIYGNVTRTFGTLAPGANAWTFASTSGIKTLDSNGATWDFPIIFNGAGGTWALSDALTVGATRSTTLTFGALNLNNFVLQTGTFASSNLNVRSINFGTSGRIDVSSTTATTTIFVLLATNLTVSGNPTVGVVGAGTQTRTINNGYSINESSAWDYIVNTSGGSTVLPAYTRTLTQVAGSVSNTTLNIYGGYIYTAGTITSTGINFIATSGTWPLSFTALPENLVFNGTGGTWQLINNSSVTDANTITLTNGTLNLDNFVLQTGVFSSNNSNTRTLAFGTGSGKIVTLGSSTVWDTGTITGLSVTGTPLVEITGSTNQNRTVIPGAPTEANSISFSTLLSSPSAPTTITSGAIRDLIVNTTGILDNTALTIYGSVTTTAGTLTSGTNTWTFASTSGTKILNGNGLTWNFPITFDGVGGAWQLSDTLTVGATRTATLTAGTLDLNDSTLSVGSFSSSGTTARTIAFGNSGSITLSSATAATTIWDTSTATNLTTTGTTSVTAANAAGTKTINTGTMSESNAINFTILTPATVTIGSSTFKNLVMNNASLAMSLTSTNLVVYGNFTITALSSWSATNSTISFSATSGIQTVTSAGKTLAGTAVSVSGTSTVTLADALAADSLTLNSGALTSGFNVTVASFSSSNANARSLVISAGTWTLTGTGSVWDIGTSTGMTLSAGTSTILISNSSTTARTFAGGGLTYNNLTFGGSGSYTVTITGSNTFTTLADTKSTAYTIKFAAGATNTFTDWTITGTAGSIVTLASSTPGSTYTLTKTVASAFQTNYMSISDATATPSNTWYSSRSTDGGNNTGIIFAARPLYWVGATGAWDTDTENSQWAYTSGGTIVSVVPVEDCDVFFDANSDSGTSFTVTVGNGATCRDMTVSGLQFTMTLAGTSAWSITGSLIWPASNFIRGYTGAITFTSSIANTITLSGKTLASTITFNGTGSWTLGSAFTTSGASTTLTAGTLNLGSYTFTTPIFLTNNSNVRSINFGTGKIVLSLNSDTTTTIWDMTTVSNFAVAGTSLVEVITSSPTSGTKRVYAGNVSETQSVSFSINSSDATEYISLYGRYKNLSINTTNSDVEVVGAVVVYGNFTRTSGGAGSGSLIGGAGDSLTFASSDACTITTANRTLNFPVEFSGTGSWTLQDTFTVDGIITLTRGTFNANNFSVTAQSFISSNSNVRTINMGSGTWRVGTGSTGSLAVWDLTNNNNLTLNADTSTITITTQNANETYTFVGGSRTYNNLTVGSGSTASLTGNTIVITGANTFNTFASAKTVAFTIQFPAAQTTTFSAFTVSGTLGNVVEIKSSTPTVQATLSKPTVWYVGSNSTNGGNNDNLLFGGGNGIDYLSFQDINGDPPVPASSGFFMFCT